MPDLNTLSKGMQVNVTGRLRTFRYTNTEGIEKQLYEVVANKVRIITEDDGRA
jgi:single-stranded DNA-binding protein